MVLERYYLECLAHASYLVADQRAGVAAVIDPQRDVDQYVDAARRLGCRIGHVFLTHFHADFVAGHLELREREGAAIHLGARAEAEYEFQPMGDGDSVELGPDVRLEVLETPGHSPESISLLVFDRAIDGSRPHAVLTGDTLFIGDVGRPDLRASLGWRAEALGALLYDSLHAKLLSLPDETLVYPAHGAGSLCGRALSSEAASTIGAERLVNYALQPMSRDDFVRVVTADQPDTPPYFAYDAVLNTREHPTLQASLERELRALEVNDMLALRRSGAQVLDTRSAVDFERAHIAGSFNVGLDGAYATWCGAVLDRDRPVVIVADPGREREAALRLGRIGFDIVAGYVAGGMESLADRHDLLAAVARVTPPELADRLDGPVPPLVVDVRSEREWGVAHIGGSTNVPLIPLAQGLAEPPRDRSLVVHCATGYRSSVAAALLLRRGFAQVADLAGGMAAWEAAV
jgi:glyoxylase-like metal-dependent hydrolase (beta-lactamase superfamily II)/rhodanese-related sulfurtransferase